MEVKNLHFIFFIYDFHSILTIIALWEQGMMKTYQLANEGPYGTAKKIAPMTTETVKNQLNCFQTSGSAEEPVEAQGVLPDISNFKVPILVTSL